MYSRAGKDSHVCTRYVNVKKAASCAAISHQCVSATIHESRCLEL